MNETDRLIQDLKKSTMRAVNIGFWAGVATGFACATLSYVLLSW